MKQYFPDIEDLKFTAGMEQQLADVDIDERQFDRTMAIIKSMTPKERANAKLLNASRKRRVAAGGGTTVQDVNLLLKQFDQARSMMKSMMGAGKRGKMRIPFGKMPKF